MGPRLDVRPDAFHDAAQTLIAEVMAPAHVTGKMTKPPESARRLRL